MRRSERGSTLTGWLGIILIIVAILGGLWLGLWVCFIGGLVQIAEAVKADPVSSWGIAFGATRIVFVVPVAWIFFFICVFVGGEMVRDS